MDWVPEQDRFGVNDVVLATFFPFLVGLVAILKFR